MITDEKTLMAKWFPIVNQARHIPSWTEPETLCFLCEVASHCLNIIEVGTYLGKSSKVMLMANPSLRLVCIDADLVFGVIDVAEHFMREEILEGRCHVFRQKSAVARHNLDDGAFDAAWIDGGHDTPTVLADIENIMPKLKSGGLMIGHDFDGDNDVAIAVKQALPAYDIAMQRVWRYRKP